MIKTAAVKGEGSKVSAAGNDRNWPTRDEEAASMGGFVFAALH